MAADANRVRPPGVAEYLFNEARHAVHDIRQKLFEEAWFGRVVTAEPVMEVFRYREREERSHPAFEEAWGLHRHGPESLDQEKNQPSPEIDR